jgi:hypothetical protein
MSAVYVDQEYVTDRLGPRFVAAIERFGGVNLDGLILSASGLVRQRIGKAQKYEPPNTDDPGLVTDETIKSATLWAIWYQLATIPESSITIPQNYHDHPLYLAWVDVGDPTARLDLPFQSSGAEHIVIGDRVI